MLGIAHSDELPPASAAPLCFMELYSAFQVTVSLSGYRFSGLIQSNYSRRIILTKAGSC